MRTGGTMRANRAGFWMTLGWVVTASACEGTGTGPGPGPGGSDSAALQLVSSALSSPVFLTAPPSLPSPASSRTRRGSPASSRPFSFPRSLPEQYIHSVASQLT